MTKLNMDQLYYLGKVRVVLRKNHNQDTSLYKRIVSIMNNEQYTAKDARWINTTVKNYYESKL